MSDTINTNSEKNNIKLYMGASGFNENQSECLSSLFEKMFYKITDKIDRIVVNTQEEVDEMIKRSIKKEVKLLLAELTLISSEIEKIVKKLSEAIPKEKINNLIKTTDEALEKVKKLEEKADIIKDSLKLKLETIYSLTEPDFTDSNKKNGN